MAFLTVLYLQSFFSENKHDSPSLLFAGGGSRRKLLEERSEKEHETSENEQEMDVAVDSDHDSDQPSKAIAIPSANSEEKPDGSLVDSSSDAMKPFSDAIQSYTPSNGKW